jgi:hypothetical protein
MSTRAPLVVVQDLRESFNPPWSPDIVVERAELECGNYSLQGHTATLSFQIFWSLGDLAACVDQGREAFEAFLERLASYRTRFIIVVGHQYTELVAYVAAAGIDAGVLISWADNEDATGVTRTMEWHFRRLVRLRELN